MGSVPRYYFQRDCNELKLLYAPSHRPAEGALDENLPRNSNFFIHGLYPSHQRHEVKDNRGQVLVCGKVHNIQTTPKHDIHIDYHEPNEAVKKELKQVWRSSNCNFPDESLWEHEWNKHGKYNNFANRDDYWSHALGAAKPYLDGESPKNLGNFLQQQGYISGQEYDCLTLRNKLDQLVGHKVNISFRQHDSNLYLAEVRILFDNTMKSVIDNERPDIDSGTKFMFEDWCGRFNLPREGAKAGKKRKASQRKKSRRLRFNMYGKFKMWSGEKSKDARRKRKKART